MSSPKVIVQIAIAGAQIFGKAFLAAGRQAVQNAKHRPEGAIGSDVTGLRSATSGSLTDRLSREHRMTLDEARLILNVRKEDTVEKILQHYEHLFKANAPASASKASKPKAGEPVKPVSASAAARKAAAPPAYSHYLQSKVVRARERIEAENKAVEQGLAEGEPLAGEGAKTEASAGQQQDGGKAS
ncbi:hypothetical protein EIP86_005085 [Pleurotus ostreatoroseus]|nr:hypothetical protein EIP86_005085 [Pleurotus ostreatoroseus]